MPADKNTDAYTILTKLSLTLPDIANAHNKYNGHHNSSVYKTNNHAVDANWPGKTKKLAKIIM